MSATRFNLSFHTDYHAPCAQLARRNRTSIFSYNGEDAFVYRHLFPHKRGGTFVELGGYHPYTVSNTWFLEKCMGWGGLVIEPQERLLRTFRESRRKVRLEGACIARRKRDVEFVTHAQGAGVGGVPGDGASVVGMLRYFFGDALQLSRIPMRCVTMQSLFDKHGIRHVDYFSLDCEGCEMDAIAGIDFSRTRIDVFTVEGSPAGRRAVHHLTRTRDYRVVARLKDDFVLAARGLSVSPAPAAERAGAWIVPR